MGYIIVRVSVFFYDCYWNILRLINYTLYCNCKIKLVITFSNKISLFAICSVLWISQLYRNIGGAYHFIRKNAPYHVRGVPFCESSLSYHYIIVSEAWEKIVKKKKIHCICFNKKKNLAGSETKNFPVFFRVT